MVRGRSVSGGRWEVGRREIGSADWQSAVPPIGNRPGVSPIWRVLWWFAQRNAFQRQGACDGFRPACGTVLQPSCESSHRAWTSFRPAHRLQTVNSARSIPSPESVCCRVGVPLLSGSGKLVVDGRGGTVVLSGTGGVLNLDPVAPGLMTGLPHRLVSVVPPGLGAGSGPVGSGAVFREAEVWPLL
jgi:hypothetical protein